MSFERKGIMTAETVTADSLGAPTATWLRRQGYSAKQVARVVGSCEGVGKQLRSGRAPTADQMAKLSHHFGWSFVQFIFTHVIGPQAADPMTTIERRLARLEEKYAAERQSFVESVPALAFLAPPRLDAPMGEPAQAQE